jgi:ubiquinone/menaquinone biosynthesis C-methylase UbiE
LRDSTLEKHLKTVDLPSVLHELGARNIDFHLEAIRHFTEKEAEKRDKIVLGYFGENGVKQIVEEIVTRLSCPPNALVLDIGAGSGFFTTKVADKLKKRLPNASFYAMDATPAMLLALIRKTDMIIPFLGISENIPASIENAKKYTDVPAQFDAVLSTLMLHHCADVDMVFQSVKRVLKSSGKAVVVDLCTHGFTEFKEMGDLHLGFDPGQIRQAGKKVFSTVTVKKLPGIRCESSGRSAELFIATLEP